MAHGTSIAESKGGKVTRKTLLMAVMGLHWGKIEECESEIMQFQEALGPISSEVQSLEGSGNNSTLRCSDVSTDIYTGLVKSKIG